MSSRSQGAGRFPRDVQARERLRQAQDAEARAVRNVCAAQEALAAATRKRDRALAVADVALAEAEHALALAQANLVDVSGLGRACVLLGLNRVTLRKARALARSQSGAEASA